MKKRVFCILFAGMLSAASVPVSAADTFLTGDLNADGVIDRSDIELLRQYLLTADPVPAERADIVPDGILNAADLSALKNLVLNGRTPDETRKLIWSDEFDGTAPDLTKWSYELGNWKLDANGNYVTNGWGNNEQEFYTDRNASVHDGILTIAARHEDHTDPVQGSYSYTSARLSSQYKFSACGGRIEVRARCDAGKSLWPAIWMLPEDSVYGGWAASGEIDIMEGWGSTPEKICGTIHFGDVWPNNTYLTNNYEFPAGDSAENWHTYAIEWESGEIRWYVDDTLYSTQTDWYSEGHAYPAPFNQNFYLILNLAVGGHFDGVDGIYGAPETFADGERHFDIDYVRVYAPADGQMQPAAVTSLPLELYSEGSDAELHNPDGETQITIRNTGTLQYGVMGLIRAQQVQADKSYTLSFDASSTAAREMLITAEDAAYQRYLEQTVMLTPEQTHYEFQVTFPADMAADLKFQLGSLGDAAAAGTHTVTLKHIAWNAQ